jgi:hypothetical protein
MKRYRVGFSRALSPRLQRHVLSRGASRYQSASVHRLVSFPDKASDVPPNGLDAIVVC